MSYGHHCTQQKIRFEEYLVAKINTTHKRARPKLQVNVNIFVELTHYCCYIKEIKTQTTFSQLCLRICVKNTTTEHATFPTEMITEQ